MGDGLRRAREVGRVIKAAASSGGVRFVNGVATAAGVAGGWVAVDVGDQVVAAKVPGTIRAGVAAGADIRLSVQGTLYTVDSVLPALSTPTMPAKPTVGSGYASTVGGDTESPATGSTLAQVVTWAGWTSEDVNTLRDEHNDLVDFVNTDHDDISAINSRLDALVTALRDQGHVV